MPMILCSNTILPGIKRYNKINKAVASNYKTMKLKQILILFLVLVLPGSFISAQQHADGMAPLRVNPYLVNYANQAKKKHTPIRRLIYDSIWDSLPFLDDFSHGGPYPDTNLWIDNAAFINNTYPICPPTLGVATLDGVNNEGRPYNPNCPPGSSYPADSLTSRPIRMNYPNPNGQNIWFSFYWQAGGRGFAPLTSDTLLLQFRTSKTPWTTIWCHLGYSPVAPDTGFHLVMIQLLDTMHPLPPLDTTIRFNPFDKNFQFRFKNYACTSADADQWNIDEVYLNKHRSASDTIFNDISFVYESPRILANYEYMPWEQFTANDVADTLYLTERNNTSTKQQITYHLDIPSAIPMPGYNPRGDINIFPPDNTSIILAHIPVKSQFTYTPLSGPTDMQVRQYFTFTGDAILWNDTLSFDQVFHDFYAYDDGTAEASYFVYGTAPVDLAEEITLNKQDTLRGVEVYFNYMYVNPANYNMIFAVWDNTGPQGSPGNIIFQDDTLSTPRVSDTLNGFTFYAFSKPVVCKAGQSVYVGWIQPNGDSLNIGLDLNTNSVNKICYYDNAVPSYWSNGWNPASITVGSIMMRPVFGGANSHGPVLSTSEVTAPAETVNLYPNPANDRVMLSSAMPANTVLKIYTIDGRQYLNNDNFSGNSINTSMLAPGFYIVEVTPAGGQTSYQKLLIQR